VSSPDDSPVVIAPPILGCPVNSSDPQSVIEFANRRLLHLQRIYSKISLNG
jgi:hypothetical protein